jgi:hypothetical protein
MNLIACASTSPSSSVENATFTPESFSNNPRILFRDVTVSSYPVEKIKQKNIMFNSIKEQYGTSINDSFNDVSHGKKSDIFFEKNTVFQKTPQMNAVDGTTYVPMTFPIPPPKDMIEKFHMQVG